MTESKWNISKVLREGEQKRGKETAHEMFIDGKNITEIKKYSKLPDNDLTDVLRSLPKDMEPTFGSLRKK